MDGSYFPFPALARFQEKMKNGSGGGKQPAAGQQQAEEVRSRSRVKNGGHQLELLETSQAETPQGITLGSWAAAKVVLFRKVEKKKWFLKQL